MTEHVYPHMVQEYYVARLREIAAQRAQEQRLAKAVEETAADAEAPEEEAPTEAEPTGDED